MTQTPKPPVHDRFMRVKPVVSRLGVSRSYFLAGVKAGRFPPGTLLSARVRVWRESEIDSLVASIGK